jgi:hypothetical protein
VQLSSNPVQSFGNCLTTVSVVTGEPVLVTGFKMVNSNQLLNQINDTLIASTEIFILLLA